MRRSFVGGFVVAVVAAVCIAVSVEAEQPTAARASTYLVQLSGPVLDQWKAAIADEGGELLDYVPQFAFRVRMTADAAARVRRLAFVSSVSAPRPEHTFARDLRRNGSRLYVVRVEPGAQVISVAAALRAAGVQVLARERQLMIVADSTQLDALSAVDGVATIENFAPRIKHNEYGGGVIMGSSSANASGFDGSSQTIAIADTGLGFGTAATAHQDLPASRIVSIFNWPGAPDFCFETINNDGAQDVDSGHGTHVATAALGAGNGSGAGRGTAPAARLVFQSLENYAVPSLLCSLVYGLPDAYYLVGIPDDIGDLFNQAYQQGARVHSNSWGAEVAGEYNADAANADAFVWSHRDLAVTFSAGNSGVDADSDGFVDLVSINSPGSAKNVITVGASENDRQSHWECDPTLTYTTCAAQGGQNAIFTYGSAWPDRFAINPLRDDPSAGNAEQMAAFSSRGPTADGRIKPDVVAPGTWTLSGYSTAFQQQYDAAVNPVTGEYQYDGWGDPASAAYKYMGGTSMAAPLVAGGAAVVRDFYLKAHGHHASAALVKAALINSAVDLLDENNDGIFDNTNPIPNPHEGWGRVDLVNATDNSGVYYDEGAALSTGTSTSFAFDVASAGAPLKVTLAWTDYPSSTSAATNLVNDLDLVVTAPDGTTFTGNSFAGGWSVAGGSADRLNNVENVYVFAAAAGTWTISVSGYNVPQGPQPFAIVIDAPAQSGTPLVRVTVDDATATEAGPTGGVVRFTRSGDTSTALDVTYNVSGSAAAGSDYVALSGHVTIPEGAVDATVSIDAIDDLLYEASETVVVTVASTQDYNASSPSSGVVTILSDDLPPDLVVTAISGPTVAAAGATINVTVTTRNQGSGPAPASQTGFYLSANNTWSSSDLYLAERAIPALGAGASDAASISLEIPAGTLAGTYFIVSRADWTSVIEESNELNNVKATSALKVGPDLLVSSLTGPTTANAGDPIVVSDTTKNQGGATSPATTTAFYLSSNTTLDASDVALGSRPVNPLAYNATHAAQTTLIIPAATGTGTYYVLAQADSANAAAEVLETNNVKASGAVKIGADLSITVLTMPSYVGVATVISVTDTTANIGATDAPESTTSFYFSANTTLDAADALLASRAVPALAAGATSSGTVQVTIPTATTGTYYVFANADAGQDVTETIETNNTRRYTLYVGPDLSLAAIDPPRTAEAGGPLNVTESTTNIGGGAASETQTAFYLSTNAAWDAGDLFLGARTVPPLSGGQISTATVSLTVPAGTASGTYYVIAKADSIGSLPEISETNNVRAGALSKIGPDLLVSIFNAPSTVVRGTAFTVGDTTRNDGSAAAATTTSYYLSTNNMLDAGDLLVGSRAVSALAYDAQHAAQVSIVIPATQTTGTYYLIAKADSANVAVEALETNNTRSRSIRIDP
jgi:serine protease AprX